MYLRRWMSSSAAGPIETSIRKTITEALHPTLLTIANDSSSHAHHASMRGATNTTESHFRMTIVSKEFENVSKPMRHRMVYRLLADLMAMENGVHAVQLSTKTPEEAARDPKLSASEARN